MRTRDRGFTLLEIIISTFILALIVLGALALFKNQTDVVGTVANNDFTVFPAETALARIRKELSSAVESPGVTTDVAPAYAVYTTNLQSNVQTGMTTPYASIVWRPVVGVPQSTDPAYSSYFAHQNDLWKGCTSNGVLYANVAKKIFVRPSTAADGTIVNLLVIQTLNGVTTTTAFGDQTAPIISNNAQMAYLLPNGIACKGEEILLGNTAAKQSVTAFRLYNAQCTAAGATFAWQSSGTANTNWPGGAPANSTAQPYAAIGVYLRVEHKSVNPADFNANNPSANMRTSNYDNRVPANYGTTATGGQDFTDLHMVVQVQAETLSVTSSGPYTGS
jgi:prepilin-type N-terminal cleavage/methylation domain-containing protein